MVNRVEIVKQNILKNICYTELVYSRINKKLGKNYSKAEIENMIMQLIIKTEPTSILKKGKNYYLFNEDNNIRITINSNNYRIITVDRLK